jgi:hypothetical protein
VSDEVFEVFFEVRGYVVFWSRIQSNSMTHKCNKRTGDAASQQRVSFKQARADVL